MTNNSDLPADWNGTSIPPRPPLPPTGAPTDAQPAPEPPKFKIGMPPGMDVNLDTVPSSDHAVPIPVAKPEFGPAPTLYGRTPTPPPPAAPAPVQALAPVQAPAAPTGPVAPVAPAAPDIGPRLVLPDGVVLPLTSGLIVGRDPQQQDGYGVTALAPLHDIERSVSKTHAVLGVSDGRVWIIDLNSTNGTYMVAANGTLTPCPPEVATPLEPGADIRFGEYRVRVALD
ncbi:FHA domain-containing protein [Mycetocola zhadangensis]|uniref:FHA domain-containing protein n=1 Tax=Mycetocola zhadangensis TaxID=1164595 RepID=A0A3L7J4D5_9MICO|nr:FHA domain-containing protein [Mycetocola zhadangensis]RLQ85384.1 FHA domain-containing protein [Mycetocola zhadangensis]GGE82126.1 hypothetical protein GCM10011313_00700 [Mycetocola zhadangensis]